MIQGKTRLPPAIIAAWALLASSLAFGAGPDPKLSAPARARASVLANQGLVLDAAAAPGGLSSPSPKPARGVPAASTPAAPAPASSAALALEPAQVVNSLKTVGLFAAVSLAPVAVLMFTAFVRINIVLILLRQALGSPQVPGNQVLTALALLLTALVMRPEAEAVYTRAIEPYASGRLAAAEAWNAGSRPIKSFMVRQIERTNHQDYLWQLYDLSSSPSDHRTDPVYGEEFPMRVIAPAYLLSELTTGLVIGFYLYLPFLVIDLVVSAVLAAMGLFMLPPSLVALPLKLILFVLADGWMLVASMLVRSFAT